MAKKKDDKRRVIVDYKNITQEQLELLSKEYPYGIDEDDIFSYKNSKGELVETVPLETEDTKYLFKISTKLEAKLEAFNEDDDDDNDSEDIDIDDVSETPEDIED